MENNRAVNVVGIGGEVIRVLIVGGAGYIGGALTEILRDSDHEFLVYDLLLYEESYRKNVPFIFGDIRDETKLTKYLNWADCVVWLAALVGDPACALNEALTLAINKTPVEFLSKNYSGRIVYMTSCSVYGAGDDVLKEDSTLSPLSLYAEGKVEAEQILENTNAICFRLGTVHGISDSFSRIRFDLVVNTLVMRAIYHSKISVFGGDQYRPMIHVRDVAKAISLVLDQQTRGIYNIHHENMKIIDIANKIKAYFPSLEVEATDSMFQDKRNYRVSSSKAEKELGFNPTLTVDDSIQELKKLLEDGRVKDSFLKRYSNYLYLKPLLEEYNSPLYRETKFNL